MKKKLFRLGTAIDIALLMLLLITASLYLGTPTVKAFAAGLPADGSQSDISIRARFATSIPFGMADTLILSEDGRVVHVTGHGTCQEGGETFDVRATITQERTNAKAKSHYVEQSCDAAVEGWSVTARVAGNRTLTTGDAEACAMALVRIPRGETIVNKWCKPVELE